MEDMSKAEYQAFLMKGSRTGKLATVRPDGRAHLAPIWFVLETDDNHLYFMTHEESVKGKNLKQGKSVSLCVDDEEPPFHFVIVEGDAEILDMSPEEQLKWSTRIAGRYMGAELADQYGKRNAVPGELVVRIVPTNIIAKKNIAH